jgi:hypothetical protein
MDLFKHLPQRSRQVGDPDAPGEGEELSSEALREARAWSAQAHAYERSCLHGTDAEDALTKRHNESGQ